jgi:ATP-dependent Clp protease ATP-binding subunit ClpC
MARLSREVQTILAQADSVARASGRPTASVHILVAFCFVDCQARDLLAEAGVDDKRVLDTFEGMSERDEPTDALRAIHVQAETLTASANAAEVSATILLASVLRVREALAWRVLEAAGVDSTRLRARVIGQITLHRDRAATGTFKVPKVLADERSTTADVRPPRPTTPRSTVPLPTAAQATLPLTTQVRGAPTPAALRPSPEPPPEPPLPLRALDPRQYPTLCELGRNLTQAALEGGIDPIIGRDEIIDAVIDVLLMKQVNNPCLVGEAGVGKTAVVEALALRLAQEPMRYGKLGEAVLVEVQVGSLLAGTALRGAFSERMKKLREEVERGAGRVIVFIDEIHTLMGAGTGDGPLDAANDLKSALSRGKFPLIGATTRAEYDRHIAKDPAMERRFQVVAVPEPSVSEAITILAGVAPTYTAHHGVRFSPEALQSAVHLSKRFITDQCLPHKAIAVIDRAASQARRAGKTVVQVDDVARAVHVLTQVPMERLLADERGRIRDLAAELCARVLGHDDAMARVAKRVQRNYAGFSGDRPVASFLFVGAPGSGKTEAARALAEVLFSRDDALVRLDMTEYAEPHTVARLIGSPPGYVGHGQPGLLGQALTKRPYRVLLFDEIDRAAPEVLALLLQLLDAGRLTDAQGVTIDARNCIVVLTSNLGAELLAKGAGRRTIGFGAATDPSSALEATDQAVLERAKSALPAEFWGRIDDVLVFRPLDLAAARAIVRRTLAASAARLFEARLVRYDVDDAVVELVLAGGLDPAAGVRPLRARVESLVEAFIADRVLDGSLQPGSEALLTVVEGDLQLRTAS